MFKFIHAGDVHLGTTFHSRPELGRELQEALRRSVEDLATVAIEREVDLVLIAGDLFEVSGSGGLSLAMRSTVLDTFRRLTEAGIKTFIAPGNHDPITPAGVYRQLIWPNDVTIFESVEPRAVDIDDTDPPTTVHGVGHTSSRTSSNLVQRIKADDDGRFHIGLVHCNVQDHVGAESQENYAPCVRGDFVGRGIGYWALGHLHAPDVVAETDDPSMVAAYCGCLCGLGYGDLGPRGCSLITVHADRSIERGFLPIGRLRWEQLDVQPAPDADVDAILAAVRRHVESLSLGDHQCCLRVRLTGPSDLFGRHEDQEWHEQAEILTEELGLLDVEIDVRFRPTINLADYADQPHILGELIRTYREMITADGGLGADALKDVLAGETLRRPSASHRKMTDDQEADYQRRVLDRAMDVLVEAFAGRKMK